LNKYVEWKKEKIMEFNKLPIFFAFDDKQFKEILKELDLNTNNYQDKLINIGSGGYMMKADKPLLNKYNITHDKEYKALMVDRTFIYDAFRFELEKHNIKVGIKETLQALNITKEDLKDNKLLAEELEKAIKEHLV
jgi:hypothetical protein